MMDHERDAYCEKFHVKRVERSCGTCKFFERSYEESGCHQPRQADFDEIEQERRRAGCEFLEDYGPYSSGVEVDEGFVCDLWEKKEGEPK